LWFGDGSVDFEYTPNLGGFLIFSIFGAIFGAIHSERLTIFLEGSLTLKL
jgi:hypothetical protein